MFSLSLMFFLGSSVGVNKCKPAPGTKEGLFCVCVESRNLT